MPPKKKLQAWFWELTRLVGRKTHAKERVAERPPEHYLGHVIEGKAPVVLIPGVDNSWMSLKHLGDAISLQGHLVYVAEDLKNNLQTISEASEIVREFVVREDLKNVVIVGHSRGGLVGKYYLIHHNGDERVRGVVAIAAPFSGSKLAHLYRPDAFKELRIQSSVIHAMAEHTEVNGHVISIYPEYDTHVWSEEGCYLEGAAQNIELPLAGHNAMLFSKETIETVIMAVNEIRG